MPSKKQTQQENKSVSAGGNPAESIAAGDNSVVFMHRRFLQKDDKYSLREWWHSILSNYGRYSCYAIFLVLPSDKEIIRYLTNFGRELDLISGNNCLIIALSKSDFRRSGFDEEIQSEKKRATNFIEHIWIAAVKEHITTGYSVQVAKLFNINYVKFPCLVVFQDIRSPLHTIIALKDMTAEEIAEKMRVIFSVIQEAASVKKNPLDALQSYRTNEALRQKGSSIVSELRNIAGKTFETAIDSWIKASIK